MKQTSQYSCTCCKNAYKNVFCIYSFLFMFLNPIFALAQSNGIVVNSNNQPLKNVDVFLADQNIVVKTNIDGEFFFCLLYTSDAADE